jgi:hypothetical protein
LRTEFETNGRAVPAPADSNESLCFFSVGPPIPGQEIRIVDERGDDVPDRTIGRLLLRGETTMSGYYRDAEATAAVTREGGWIDSGDFGYLSGGEFFFTGRSRDTIQKAGRSMSPFDVEAAVGSLDGVIPGSAVAFGAPDKESGSEHVVVAAETRANSQEDFRRLEAEIVRVVDGYLGMAPDRIQLVEAGSLPRTQNGKVRRNEIRSLYTRGKLRAGGRPPWLQIVRLRRENLGALVVLGLRRTNAAVVRHATRSAASVVARLAGGWTRVTRSRGVVRLACRWILKAYGQRYSLQGALQIGDGQSAVLIANRSGMLDPLVMLTTLPGSVWFADRSALSGLPRSLAYLLEPLVLGDRQRGTVPAAGSLENRIRRALKRPSTIVAFPEGPVGASVFRSSYRLDPFRAAVEMGAPLHPAAVRERAQQKQPVERARVRRVTMVIIREPAAVNGDADFFALRDRLRESIGEYHA